MNKFFLVLSPLLSFSSSPPRLTPLYLFLLLLVLWTPTDGVGSECSNEKLVLYQIHIATHWSRENFPKQYPEFRPPAQFSKLVGRSHSEDFQIFELGQLASEGVKQFAETGISSLLDEYSQGGAGVLDAFNAPAIGQGVGETETQFFLDGIHSRVSLVMRIIPSPDWFIGISGLDLCAGKEWIESMTINVTHLYDAGTDSGYTFTAPNYATVPAEPITSITSQAPRHKASSFYYPDKSSLPPIATITITKRKEYSQWQASTAGTPEASAGPSAVVEDSDSNDVGNEGQDLSETDAPPAPAASLKQVGKRRRLRKFKGSRVRDCRMTEWSEWSECSALCGVGVQYRTRSLIHHPRGGGAPCPPPSHHSEKRLCNSDRDCRQNYFDWQ